MTTAQNVVTLAGLQNGRTLRRVGTEQPAEVLMLATDDTETSVLVLFMGTEWVFSVAEVSELFTF